jgi:aminoglycoside/choline kinase family phosphotransferase
VFVHSGSFRGSPDGIGDLPGEAWTTADAVVPPDGADAAAWAAATDVIRKPPPPYEGRFLHRDFPPGNVLFDVPPSSPAGLRTTGVVDWVQAPGARRTSMWRSPTA